MGLPTMIVVSLKKEPVTPSRGSADAPKFIQKRLSKSPAIRTR